MPDTGVDALEAANAILTALYAQRGSSLTRASSQSPGIVVADAQRRADQGRHQHQRGAGPGRRSGIDRRMIPEENPGARSRPTCASVIETAARARSGRQASTCDRLLLADAAGAAARHATGSRPRSQRHAKRVLGVDVPLTGVPLYTDARHYAAARHSDRALWRGAALDPRSQRAQRQREPAARPTCARPPRSSRWPAPICSVRERSCRSSRRMRRALRTLSPCGRGCRAQRGG